MRKSSSLYSIDAFVERKITSEKYQDVITVADNIADVITVSDNIADVNTVATDVAPNILDVVTVADNIASVVIAATNIADILTVAANDANVTTVAGLDAEIIALAGIITALQSLYTDKATLDSLYADKATLDSLYADKTTLDSLFADKATLDSLFADKTILDSLYADKATLDAVYADLSNIDIVATNIADVNTVTSNIVAIGDVATDIANVNTVATNITDVNTIADNMTDVTYFADVYQGPKAVEPTLRNDGSALQSGDLYFDTVFNKMMVYGIEWTPAASAVNGTDSSEHFVATAGQTLFTLSSGYDVGYLYVFQNGVLLDSADFTATDGSTFTLTTGATVDDNIFALAMGAFALADHYTKSEIDAQLTNYYTTTEVDAKPTGFKNLVINGTKTIQQRGTTGGTRQVIDAENVTFSGDHTVSFTGAATIRIYDATTLGATDATTTWTELTSGASVSGTTVSVTAARYVKLEFSSTDFDFVQLEPGTVPTAWEQREMLEEFLCLGYYQKYSTRIPLCVSRTDVTSIKVGFIPLVRKRRVPDITGLTSTSGDPTGAVVVGKDGVYIANTGSTSAESSYLTGWIADAEHFTDTYYEDRWY